MREAQSETTIIMHGFTVAQFHVCLSLSQALCICCYCTVIRCTVALRCVVLREHAVACFYCMLLKCCRVVVLHNVATLLLRVCVCVCIEFFMYGGCCLLNTCTVQYAVVR